MSEIKAPVFSIITPTFQRPLLLARTIRSVVNQTFSDYEHIIIDDANDPETERIVNSFYDKRIIFQQHEVPRGAAGGYNTGIKLSRGSLILFLDDDDEYLPSFLEKMYNRFLESEQNVGFIWTGISRILDSESGEKLIFSKVWPSHFPVKEDGLCEATAIGNGYGVCVRKKCIDIIGSYDESIIFGHDTDFLFRLVKVSDFVTIPEVLVKIHQHCSSQLTDKKNYPLRLELREKILSRHLDLLNKFPRLYYIHYRVVVDLCYILNLRKKGRKILISIIKKSPSHFLRYTDLLIYELTGTDTISFYYNSRIRKLVHYMKGK